MLGLAALFVTVAVSGEPSLGSSELGPHWLGVTFGSAAVRYREQLGDPLRVTPLSDRPERRARYLLARAPRVFLILTERKGAVTGIEASSETAPAGPLSAVEADPSGIRLGSTLDEVAAARPAARRWTDADGALHLREEVDAARGIVADYRFAGKRLVADSWLSRSNVEQPQLPGATPLAEAAGESELSAILDAQTNDRDGVDWVNLYLRFHPCDGTMSWLPGEQSLRTVRGRVYDVIAVTCPPTGEKRDFYFDVTAFYGKV